MNDKEPVNLRCENCGQAVLPTDTVCWQCGWKLAATAVDRRVVDEERPLSVTAVAVYAALSLFIILALLVVFSILGSYPS